MTTDMHAPNDAAQQFATEHLAECARELLAWPQEQLPVEGRVRTLSRMIAQTEGNNDALMLAIDMVNRLTREATVAAHAHAPHSANEETTLMSDSAKPVGEAASDADQPFIADELAAIRAACEAQVKAWSEVRDQHGGMLVGNRVIVLDERGRAYGALPDGRYKLEYPRTNLVGVSHFPGHSDASALVRRLESAHPQFAPYSAVDYRVYAEKRIGEAQASLKLVEARADALTSKAPLPPSRTWTITASSGEFVVNAETGELLSYTVYSGADDPVEFRERAEKIDRFNVVEYRQWFESVGLEEPTNLNWLGIGFWQKDGFYESFEQDWRDDLVAAMASGAAVETEPHGL